MSVFLLSLLLVETVVLPGAAVGGVAPDLTVLAIVGIGLTDGPATGARYGFAAGFLRDLLVPTADLMGPWALAMLLVGFLAGSVRPFVSWSQMPGHVVLGALGAFSARLLVGLLDLLLAAGIANVVDVATHAVIVGGWGLVLAPIMVRVTQRLALRTTPAELLPPV